MTFSPQLIVVAAALGLEAEGPRIAQGWAVYTALRGDPPHTESPNC